MPMTTQNTKQLTRVKVMAKKTKKVAPKGSHYMPNGKLMKDSAMKPVKKKGKSSASY